MDYRISSIFLGEATAIWSIHYGTIAVSLKKFRVRRARGRIGLRIDIEVEGFGAFGKPSANDPPQARKAQACLRPGDPHVLGQLYIGKSCLTKQASYAPLKRTGSPHQSKPYLKSSGVYHDRCPALDGSLGCYQVLQVRRDATGQVLHGLSRLRCASKPLQCTTPYPSDSTSHYLRLPGPLST